MRPVRSSEKSIFLEALDIESIEERTAFVESACRGDAALLSSVTALLREHEREDNPVDTPIVAKRDLRPSANDETESVCNRGSGGCVKCHPFLHKVRKSPFTSLF